MRTRYWKGGTPDLQARRTLRDLLSLVLSCHFLGSRGYPNQVFIPRHLEIGVSQKYGPPQERFPVPTDHRHQ
jgi:hypothetical protein